MLEKDLPSSIKETLAMSLFEMNKGVTRLQDASRSWLETGYIHPEGNKTKKLFSLS